MMHIKTLIEKESKPQRGELLGRVSNHPQQSPVNPNSNSTLGTLFSGRGNVYTVAATSELGSQAVCRVSRQRRQSLKENGE
eukprot:scaffold1066_cov177-Skeletonema_marinoi.AAC.13